MMKKRLIAGLLALSLVVPATMSLPKDNAVVKAADVVEKAVERDTYSNPIVGTEDGKITYGGDPSVLVDGDTVYLYVGHDTSTNATYVIPEYLCYSTKDLKNWTSHGSVLKMTDVSWADNNSAWAGQVMKHNDKYYMYYCSWDSTDDGKQSIGVAVSDTPTGTFKDIGSAIVKGSFTTDNTSGYNDIDPTAWIETDENGVEHRYLAWGNNKFYICELNEDMISVKDINGDGKITFGSEADGKTSKDADIISKDITGLTFTEAPWLYRRKDAEGKYYGSYYLFYAYGWREQMAYVTTDDLLDGKFSTPTVLMKAPASSNTNHMAVFDFNGKTYFIYHNGMLPGGSGYRRVANIAEVHFNEDGSIQAIPETVTGIDGTTTKIYCNSGKTISRETTTGDSFPFSNIEVGPGMATDDKDAEWVITDGKANTAHKAYISFQSQYSPGLYLTASSNSKVVLAQDQDGTADTAKKQTFRTLEGFADKNGVTLESVAYPGYYLTNVNGKLKLTKGNNKSGATFYLNVDSADKSHRSIGVESSKTQVYTGEKFASKNFKVTAFYANGTTKKITKFTTNASKINTKKAGKKTLTVTYKEGGVTAECDIDVSVVQKPAVVKNLKASIKVSKKGAVLKANWKKASGAATYEVSFGKTKKKHSYLDETSKAKITYKDEDGNFKKGKTYYVHVRSGVKINGEYEYTKYTTVKVKAK